jgi:hypothetical protein
MGIVNNKEPAMSTAIYEELSQQELRELRMFGATREQVEEAVASYLREGDSATQIITRMMMSAWRELNWGEAEDARQTLNRVKITIQRFYRGDQRDFFFDPAGQAFSILSDAQELMEFDDILRAKMCIDEAVQLIEKGDNIRV